MKKLTFVLIVCIISLGYLTVPQAQTCEWRWQSPSTTASWLRDIYAFDANGAIAVGNGGTIIKTTDGGDNWDIQYRGATNFLDVRYILNSVIFVNNEYGWIVGEGGTLLKTTNGGDTWSHQYPDQNVASFYGIQFRDTLNGWVAGYYTESYGVDSGQVMQTADGGRNWATSFTTAGKLLGLYFLNEDTGWVVGRDASVQTGIVYKTTDGGNTWESTLVGAPASNMEFYSVYFKDSNNGWIAGGYAVGENYSGFVYHTTDGGYTWEIVVQSNTLFYKIGFSDDTYGWISGNGILLTTSDGGNTWEASNDYPTLGQAVSLVDGIAGWSAGYVGAVNKTSDGGRTWTECEKRYCSAEVTLRGVDFIDEQKGWAVGHNDLTCTGVALHTTDGGTTWQEMDLGSLADNLFIDVAFTSPDNVWISKFTGMILHTSDGGNTWDVKFNDPSIALRYCCFINDSTGWVIDNYWTVHKTTDAGDNWTSIDLSGYGVNVLWPIVFVDESYGWIAGEAGILKTTDGGLTWQVIWPPTNPENWISDISFVNRSVGYLATRDGQIYRTVDGGVNWTECGTTPTAFNCIHTSIHFVDENEGWVGSNFGTTIHTTDGGQTWEKTATSPEVTFYDFASPTDSTVWAVGTVGAILKYSNETNVAIEEFVAIPESFSLSQNYPNPFNANTIIQYDLPVTSDVTIDIYDVLGRRVETYFNTQQSAGRHSVIWNADDYSSGMYFYKLTTGEYSETKKMTLLK